jgi:hypothetical protein
MHCRNKFAQIYLYVSWGSCMLIFWLQTFCWLSVKKGGISSLYHVCSFVNLYLLPVYLIIGYSSLCSAGVAFRKPSEGFDFHHKKAHTLGFCKLDWAQYSLQSSMLAHQSPYKIQETTVLQVISKIWETRSISLTQRIKASLKIYCCAPLFCILQIR